MVNERDSCLRSVRFGPAQVQVQDNLIATGVRHECLACAARPYPRRIPGNARSENHNRSGLPSLESKRAPLPRSARRSRRRRLLGPNTIRRVHRAAVGCETSEGRDYWTAPVVAVSSLPTSQFDRGCRIKPLATAIDNIQVLSVCESGQTAGGFCMTLPCVSSSLKSASSVTQDTEASRRRARWSRGPSNCGWGSSWRVACAGPPVLQTERGRWRHIHCSPRWTARPLGAHDVPHRTDGRFAL